MKNQLLSIIFACLLSPNRFERCDEENGPGYRQAFFFSQYFTIRIAEQNEVSGSGEAVTTCLAFCIDPKNSKRWCMFEKAVETLLGVKIDASLNLQDLSMKIEKYIDPLLSRVKEGKELPFRDFSKFA